MSRARHDLMLTLCTAVLASACAGVPLLDGDREDPNPSGPAYLRAYKESHYQKLGAKFVDDLDWAAFEQSLHDARILFLGDHHTDRDLHDRMLASLRRLVSGDRPLAIGLEAIGLADELAVARYLARDCDMRELRASLRERWSDSWLDHHDVDAGFYRTLLEFARDHSVPVFALEPTPRLALSRRDAVIASRIRRIDESLPDDRLLVVIVGHAHLLGHGGLVDRVGLPSVTVAARLSRTLTRAWQSLPRRKKHATFLRSDRDVLFFQPTETTRRTAAD